MHDYADAVIALEDQFLAECRPLIDKYFFKALVPRLGKGNADWPIILVYDLRVPRIRETVPQGELAAWGAAIRDGGIRPGVYPVFVQYGDFNAYRRRMLELYGPDAVAVIGIPEQPKDGCIPVVTVMAESTSYHELPQ